MTNYPMVSIIIPVYNSERFLKECFDSILAQTYDNYEIIVVDDGSVDTSIQIEEEYSKKVAGFRIIKQANSGQGVARNRGLDIARGEYIAFIDSDDAMKPDFLKESVAKIEAGNYDIVVANYDKINEKSEFLAIHSNAKADDTLDGYEALMEMWYGENVHIAPWGKLYKKEVFEKDRFKSCYCEDAEILERLIKKDYKILYISDSLFEYRIRSDADSWAFKPKSYEQIAVFDEMYEYAGKNYPKELIQALEVKMTSVWFHVFLQLPQDDERTEELKKRIKKHRMAVLRNKRTRRKTKIACLSSCLGFGIVRFLFNFTRRTG